MEARVGLHHGDSTTRQTRALGVGERDPPGLEQPSAGAGLLHYARGPHGSRGRSSAGRRRRWCVPEYDAGNGLVTDVTVLTYRII